jgi:MoaA/NifB/PqqE/SkfB family radical SAM enzyme
MNPHKKLQILDQEFAGCLFRIPADGGRVLWQVTNVCNYGCHYCIFASGPRRIVGELSFTEITQSIQHLANLSFSSFKFTGGEPFVRRDMIDILTFCSDRGLAYNISSNASLLDGEKVQRLKGLSGLEMMHVSFDGPTRSIHEAARGKKTFFPSLRGLSLLLEAQVPVRVGTVIFAGNEYFLSETANFLYQQGVPEVVFSLMEPAGRLSIDSPLLATRSPRVLQEELESLQSIYEGRMRIVGNVKSQEEKKNCGRCPGGERFLFIDNLGRVSPCSWISERAPEFISQKTLRDSSVDAVLGGRPMKRFIDWKVAHQRNGIGGCPLRWNE